MNTPLVSLSLQASSLGDKSLYSKASSTKSGTKTSKGSGNIFFLKKSLSHCIAVQQKEASYLNDESEKTSCFLHQIKIEIAFLHF